MVIGRVEVVGLFGLVLVFLAAFYLGCVVALGAKKAVNINIFSGSDRKPKTTVLRCFLLLIAKKNGIYSAFWPAPKKHCYLRIFYNNFFF